MNKKTKLGIAAIAVTLIASSFIGGYKLGYKAGFEVGMIEGIRTVKIPFIEYENLTVESIDDVNRLMAE